MSMVVQHNLTAMNSNRMLGITTGAQAKSTEKLSSGYKINRAADDAAGLAISEKMRKQIRGLTQASANAQDGISAVQTAEGALTEVHDMLQRMNELAVKASNGTQSISDRDAIQAEIDQLVTEIDRVAETTKFNETYLLKGDKNVTKAYSYSYNSLAASTAAVVKTNGTAGALTTGNAGLTATISFHAGTSAGAQNDIANSLVKQGLNITAELTTDKNDPAAAQEVRYSISLNGAVADKYTITATSSSPTKFNVRDTEGNIIATITASGIAAGGAADGVYSANVTAGRVDKAAATVGESEKFYDADGNGIAANALNNYFTAASGTWAANSSAGAVYDAAGNKIALTAMAGKVTANQDVTGPLQLKLHVGADATTNNQIALNLQSMSSKGLGIVGLRVDGSNDTNALSAIETIKEALQKVSAQRSDLGAVQNRLEHTINNLDNVVENTTSAESQIRDTDMATQMVEYSKNQILAQAGQSMLAQANQSNQGVLSLLQ